VINQEILKALLDVLREFEVPRVTDTEVMDSISEEEKLELSGLKGKKFRLKLKPFRQKVLSSKMAVRKSLPNTIHFGLRKCLRAIDLGSAEYILYDSSVNLPAIVTILDKTKLIKVGVPHLSSAVKELLGFQCLLVGFSTNPDKCFQSFLALLQSKIPKTVTSKKTPESKRKKLILDAHAEISVSEGQESPPKKPVAGDNFIGFKSESKTEKNYPYQTTVTKLV